jgi:hypothetical protein
MNRSTTGPSVLFFWLKTRGKPIVSLPYTQECNDVAMMLIRHHRASHLRQDTQEADVLFWTGEQILDWYLKAGPKAL